MSTRELEKKRLAEHMSNPNLKPTRANQPEFVRGKGQKIWQTEEDYMNSKLDKLKTYQSQLELQKSLLEQMELKKRKKDE